MFSSQKACWRDHIILRHTRYRRPVNPVFRFQVVIRLLKPPRKSLIANQIGVYTVEMVVGPLYFLLAYNFELVKMPTRSRNLSK